VSNPNAVQTLAQIPLNTNPVNIDVVGNMLYLVGNSPAPTLVTIDVSVLSSPVFHGIVNFLDISPFIGILSTGGTQAEADINQDGIVNFLDISPFIGILAGNQ